jgi:hypothetical protein
MRMTRLVLASPVVLACLASTALAQDAVLWESTATFGGLKGFLYVPGVKEELELTPAQVRRIEQAVDRVSMSHGQDYSRIAALKDNPAAQRARLQELYKRLAAETMRAVGGIVSAEQMKRLREVGIQVTGIEALANADVQKKLALSDEQKARVVELRDDYLEKRRPLFEKSRVLPEDREKIKELHREATAKGLSLLTDEQQKTWKELTGKPFGKDKGP